MEARRFDFVIVGGGLAGCVLASRLSQRLPNQTIALIEAGPDVSQETKVRVPMMAKMLQGSPLDYSYQTVPQKGLDGQILPHAAGRALSGGAALNYGVWMRGAAAEYDQWADMVNDRRWSYEGQLPYFKRCETYHDPHANPEVHGLNGPIHICTAITNGRQFKLTDVTRQAREGQGHKFIPDGNSGSPIGLWQLLENRRDGQRQLPSSVYPFAQKNLTVLTETTVARVLLDRSNGETPRAIGVETVAGQRITANREVILSASAYRTPQLLMLSGIGPSAHLGRHGIETVVDNAWVGRNFSDHLGIYTWWELRDKGLTISAAEIKENPKYLEGLPWDLVCIYGVDDSQGLEQASQLDSLAAAPGSRCHIESYVIYGRGGQENHVLKAVPNDGTHITAGFMPLLPTSRGSITLQSADPTAPPLVDPNYMSTHADRYVARYGFRSLMRLMLETPEFQALVERETPPKGMHPLHANSSDAQIDERIKTVAQTHYHPSGSASMGKVVNADLQVIGVDGLRVVDASVFPLPLSAHYQAPVYALAEQVADIVVRAFE